MYKGEIVLEVIAWIQHKNMKKSWDFDGGKSDHMVFSVTSHIILQDKFKVLNFFDHLHLKASHKSTYI